MVFRILLRMLMGHPQMGPALIQRLSETRPIRGAARFVAYLFLRGKAAIENQAQNPATFKVDRFKETFQRELQKAREASRQNRKK